MIAILSAAQYRMMKKELNKQGEEVETGEIEREGVSLWYIGGIKPRDKTRNGMANLGRKPIKASIPVEMLPLLKAVPGLYEAEFDMDAGRDNVGVIRIEDLEFVGTFDVKLPDEPQPVKK